MAPRGDWADTGRWCTVPGEAATSISREPDSCHKLKAERRSDSTGKTILASMEELPVRPADLEAAAYWSSGVAEARTTTPLRRGSGE